MIDLKRIDEFAILTLNRPQVLNALNREMMGMLKVVLEQVEASDARCLIITGAGDRAFCAGADISELCNRPVESELDHTLAGQDIMSQLEALRQPSIALVNGHALGGGCELALAATFRLATARARFGLPEIKLGLVPGFGGTQRLARLIGLPSALEMMMSARSVDAEEALRLRLVSRVLAADDPMSQALSFGRQFTGFSLLTQRLIRDVALRGLGQSLQQGLFLEAQVSTLSFRSEDGQEGLQAFLEKRKPVVKDR